MAWEVEQKFPLSDVAAVRQRLVERGATFESAIEQIDRYFNHPARDFAQTDEAFRLRQVGDSNFMTYKGPRLDQTTKTRRELELPLPSGESIAQQYSELLTAIGFRLVAAVHKRREPGTLAWEGHLVQIALDSVDHIGEFLELEIMADERTLADAKSSLESLTRRLNLGPSERRSYLELLLLKIA